ncbi:MAG: hypothetical protein AAB371_02665 [Patescibacteria group bacterium]
MQSSISKKFIVSIILFLIIIIAVNVIVNFQIKKIKNGISERNSLLSENSNKSTEMANVKYVEQKVKKTEKIFGMSIEDLNKVLSSKIQKPDIARLSSIFQEVAQKSSSQVALKQESDGEINGEWRGTLEGFTGALKLLQSKGLSLKMFSIEVAPDSSSKPEAKKFIINFKIQIL